MVKQPIVAISKLYSCKGDSVTPILSC